MKRHLVLAAVVVGVLSACASQQTTQTVTAGVEAAAIALTTAERLALIYKKLPRCGTVGSNVCSDPDVVKRMLDLDNTAYAAVKSAEQNQALLATAVTAIANFRSAIPAQ